MRVGLVITTYERPDALAAVLANVARLDPAPAQIVLADDGSGVETRSRIERFARESRVPVRIVAQDHAGFRLARLRNLAIAAATADYLVFLDGDMVPDPHFIGDHARLALPGHFTQGVRVPADAALTRAFIADPALRVGFARRGLGFLRRAYLLRSPVGARLARRLANGFIAVKGCNQAFWHADLVRVNGFNEAIEGWGPEDKELCLRLVNAGVRRQTLLFGGIAVHLHHVPAARDRLRANLGVLESTRRACAIRCERGLDAHLPGGAQVQKARPVG
jgi:glycosyltransferase involved in cell wall biosynthesis